MFVSVPIVRHSTNHNSNRLLSLLSHVMPACAKKKYKILYAPLCYVQSNTSMKNISNWWNSKSPAPTALAAASADANATPPTTTAPSSAGTSSASPATTTSTTTVHYSVHMMSSTISPSSVADDFKDRLIDAVKRQVKQVMEEAVTRKFIHEESGSVTALCATVEACLSQGLRRRALGLFKTSSTTALLHKIGKHCPEAGDISQKVQDIESVDPNKRSSSSGDSTSKPPILKKNSSSSIIGGSSGTSAATTPVVRYGFSMLLS